MRVSRPTVWTLAAAAMLVMHARVNAAPIAGLNPDGHQSTVSAFASDDDAGTTVTNDVNSLPYTTPVTSTDDESSSTVTPALTTSALNFTFSQSILDTTSPSKTSGTGDIFFVAGANTTYAIAGSMTLNGVSVDGELQTFLYDVTTSSYLYNYDVSTGTGSPGVQPDIPTPTTTLTLDTTGGSLTGSLTAGDSYEFLAYQEMDKNESDPGLSGNAGLSLAQSVGPGGGSSVPLPTGAFGGLVALMGLGVVACRRKLGAA